MKKNFVVVSNQRCGSTWLITSLGNCKNIEIDYETKWSNDLLINKHATHHMFLEKDNFENIFKNFKKKNNNYIYGTKFVFDFYKFFPKDDYQNFLNKYKSVKVIHITRNYLDVLKSKLIGGVSHVIDKNNYNKDRRIDKWIFDNQPRYLKAQESAEFKTDNIKFNNSNSFLMNLFINDILASSLKNITSYLNIDYDNIQDRLEDISNFLELGLNQSILKKIFIESPAIIKNKAKYKGNFEKFENLKINSNILREKINKLSKNKFNIEDILSYDKQTKKMILNI